MSTDLSRSISVSASAGVGPIAIKSISGQSAPGDVIPTRPSLAPLYDSSSPHSKYTRKCPASVRTRTVRSSRSSFFSSSTSRSHSADSTSPRFTASTNSPRSEIASTSPSHCIPAGSVARFASAPRGVPSNPSDRRPPVISTSHAKCFSSRTRRVFGIAGNKLSLIDSPFVPWVPLRRNPSVLVLLPCSPALWFNSCCFLTR